MTGVPCDQQPKLNGNPECVCSRALFVQALEQSAGGVPVDKDGVDKDAAEHPSSSESGKEPEHAVKFGGPILCVVHSCPICLVQLNSLLGFVLPLLSCCSHFVRFESTTVNCVSVTSSITMIPKLVKRQWVCVVLG